RNSEYAAVLSQRLGLSRAGISAVVAGNRESGSLYLRRGRLQVSAAERDDLVGGLARHAVPDAFRRHYAWDRDSAVQAHSVRGTYRRARRERRENLGQPIQSFTCISRRTPRTRR